VYLGAHYTSDVIGGWIIGAIGLVLIIGNFI
jgi:membrane-associated phospholipid phosphatase